MVGLLLLLASLRWIFEVATLQGKDTCTCEATSTFSVKFEFPVELGEVHCRQSTSEPQTRVQVGGAGGSFDCS